MRGDLKTMIKVAHRCAGSVTSWQSRAFVESWCGSSAILCHATGMPRCEWWFVWTSNWIGDIQFEQIWSVCSMEAELICLFNDREWCLHTHSAREFKYISCIFFLFDASNYHVNRLRWCYRDDFPDGYVNARCTPTNNLSNLDSDLQ